MLDDGNGGDGGLVDIKPEYKKKKCDQDKTQEKKEYHEYAVR